MTVCACLKVSLIPLPPSLQISFPPNFIAQLYLHHTIQEKKAEINIEELKTERREVDVHGQEEEARLL